ncbi:hypothetical protein, conserved [Leishmania tarentolae]|uniref:DUF155 domain-containing protein n=1 Tax=Leishmania tarentolae TaxID=5689 RepID=A0A640KBL0_LEITA|nr:hypothetical protein, conserved [Leishmania tarentolae]
MKLTAVVAGYACREKVLTRISCTSSSCECVCMCTLARVYSPIVECRRSESLESAPCEFDAAPISSPAREREIQTRGRGGGSASVCTFCVGRLGVPLTRRLRVASSRALSLLTPTNHFVSQSILTTVSLASLPRTHRCALTQGLKARRTVVLQRVSRLCFPFAHRHPTLLVCSPKLYGRSERSSRDTKRKPNQLPPPPSGCINASLQLFSAHVCRCVSCGALKVLPLHCGSRRSHTNSEAHTHTHTHRNTHTPLCLLACRDTHHCEYATIDTEMESPGKLQKQLEELFRPLGRCGTLRVSQIASIVGVEGEEQYRELLDLLARSRSVQYDAEKQTVRSLLETKDHLEDDDEAALLALSDGDVVGGGIRGSPMGSLQRLGVYRQHRSNSRHSYRGTAANATASGYRSDTGLTTTTGGLALLSRRRAGGAWTKASQRVLEDAASYPGPIGRVGYICVADELHLDKLEAYYRAQGYYTKFDFDVLHVRFAQPPCVSVEADAGDRANAPVGQHDRERSRHAPAAQRSSSVVLHGEDSSTSLPPPPLLERGAAAGAAQRPGGPTSASSHGYGAVGSNTRSKASTNTALAQVGDGGEAAAAAPNPSNSATHYFDLFVFPYGAVVWWGFDQRYFKIVENDYMLPHSAISHCMTNRYTTQLVNENYPVWCTFNLVARDTLEVDDNFKARLRFDHFVIPYRRGELATGSVLMLCASHALAQSAKIDYIELQVHELTDSCSPLPRELREKGAVSITERRLLQLRGEVLSYRLMLKSGSDLLDEPDFFWENSYLKPVFQATKEEYEISERVEALDNKLDAANEILSMLAEDFSQRHGARLEWIVIWLVFVEVVIGVLELLVDVRPWFQSRSP